MLTYCILQAQALAFEVFSVSEKRHQLTSSSHQLQVIQCTQTMLSHQIIAMLQW